MTLLDRLSTGWKAWVLLFVLTFAAAAPGVFTLPALDRDESRFAQASKQMLESGDYIRLRYQDELRNKKPAGIHWLQAGSTALFTGAEAKQIWTYRVPSWLGVALGTLACFWCGIPLIGRRASFLGAALFGATLLLTSEGHISKTDGVLIFLTTLSIGALARLYMQGDQSKRMALLFWTCMGLVFLIKGPVGPMVAAYAGVGAWVWTRAAGGKGGDWWRVLLWWPGPLIFVALVLPWFLWIQAATSGEYIKGAVGKDLKDKFTGASEGHGGWAFYHLTHLPAWFFPATLLLVPGCAAAWQRLKPRGDLGWKWLRDSAAISAIVFAFLLVLLYVLPLLPRPDGTGLAASTLNSLASLKTLPAYPALLLAAFWYISGRDDWKARWPIGIDGLTDETRAIRFLVAWAGLTFIFFELMPTRLSHYILPAYPAMGLLCGYAAVQLMEGARMPVSRWISLTLFAIGAIALLAASFPGVAVYFMEETAGDFTTAAASQVLESWTAYRSFPLWLWWIGFALSGLAIIEFARRHDGLAILFAIAASLAIGWHIRIYMLPSQVWMQPTETARAALEEVCGVPGEDAECNTTAPQRILALGYAEPSYILTLGTQNLHPPETPLDLPAEPSAYPVVYLVNFEDRKAEPPIVEEVASLRAQAESMGLCVTESEPYYALNYSNGDPVNFRAIRFDMGGCPGTGPDQ
ncbi:MAG: dolichyl-phosphate-mannose-protein mannosyltransferase [Hyphomonas sp. BRH_c22]|uniref:ArnT family glycosyltransferase n=1 Tax=Hyphomonas sp. BRH_c22 TaxID=1629710 RepID=UPI0005F1E377|nr:glycosyltransferase family 39 protein [Hyphomonas sp. BRH_c22]KJS37155.1 MAG: dolichyl-phosphate-mannose-protein mannosyltransferase [Hyphomonas sp. BRH_c22]